MNDRTELEQRLRDTLVAKADSIHPSPALWDRIADATTRRSRWARPSTWLAVAGVAALLIAALVIIPNLQRDPAPFDIVESPPSSSATDVPSPTVVSAPGAAALVAFREGPNDVGGFGAVVDLDPATGEVQDTLSEGQPERDTPFTVSMDLQPGTGRLAQVVGIEGVWEVRVGLPGDPDYVQFAAGEDRASEDGNDRRPAVRWTQDGQTLLWTAEAADGSDDTWLYAIDLDVQVATPGELPLGDRVLALQPPGWGVPDVRLLDVVGTRGSELSVRAAKGGEALGALLVPREGCAPGIDGACVYEIAETSIASRGPLLVAEADAGLNPGQLVGPGYQLMVEDDGPLVLSYAGDGDVFGDLTLPDELLAMAGDPLDTWMDAAGSTVVVGRGGRAWILTVTIDSDDPQVVSTVEIPGGASTAAVVLDAGGGRSATPADGEVRVEIETTTTSPSGRPVTLDTATIVGGDLDPAVRDAVNADLAALSAQVLADWDTRAEQDEDPELPAWELELEAEVTRVGPTLVSIAFAGFEFYGGANGSPYWLTRTYDLSTGDLLGYDDLFVAGSEQDVAAVVAEELATQQEFADAAALGDAMREQDGSLDRVTITGDGFRFHFDEFSLGLPGAAGAPTASVIVPDVVSVVQSEIVDRYFTDGPVREPTAMDDVEADPEASAPEVAVSFDEATRELTISGSFGPTVTVPRPDGLVEEEVLTSTTIIPTDVPGRAVLVTEYFLGDSAIRARVVVQDGEIVANERLSPDSFPGGTLAGLAADTRPTAGPFGDFIAWVQNEDGAGDRYELVVEAWEDGAPTGRTAVALPTTDRGVANRAIAMARTEAGLVAYLSVFRPGELQVADGAIVVEIPVVNGTILGDEASVSGRSLPGGLLGGAVPPGSNDIVLALLAGDGGSRRVVRLVAGDPGDVMADGPSTSGLEVVGALPEGLVVVGDDGVEVIGVDAARAATGLPDGLVAVR